MQGSIFGFSYRDTYRDLTCHLQCRVRATLKMYFSVPLCLMMDSVVPVPGRRDRGFSPSLVRLG